MLTSKTCPVCDKGEFEGIERKCNRCGVCIPKQTDVWPAVIPRGFRRRPDQDVVRPMADYARTKEDKQ